MLAACGQKIARLQSLRQQTQPLRRATLKTVERSLRKRHVIRNDSARRYHEKYKVSDDDVDKEVQKAKNQYGDQFKNVLKTTV